MYVYTNINTHIIVSLITHIIDIHKYKNSYNCMHTKLLLYVYTNINVQELIF